MSLPPAAYLKLQPHLDKARKITVLTHINPDGDAAGSGLALALYLQRPGREARFIISGPLPENLQFLEAQAAAVVYDRETCSAFIRESDMLITVDSSATSRLGPLEDDVRACHGLRVCVDHHVTTDPFWQLNIIDREACATGEMVYDLITALGGKLDRAAAEAIYVAIVTDTGGFRFSKTSGRVHRMVAGFLDLGVLPHEVYRNLYERQPLAAVRLLGEALLRVCFAREGRLAWVNLPAEMVKRCGAEDLDTSDIINHMLAVKGVEIGLLLREEPDGRTKISWRSRPQHDIHGLAQACGGGGHKNAAGALVDEEMEVCTPRQVAEAEALLA